jgi:lysozyme family protein
MSVPYMNMLPSTTDPYAQGVIQIVKGLQRQLNKRGARLEVDGGMGGRTVAALSKFAGPRWYDKSWAQLMGDVESGGAWQGWDRQNRAANPEGVDGFEEDLGADSEGIWYCSPAQPQGGCTVIPGVAIPWNVTTLTFFNSIQRAINALLAKRGKPPIGVDGRIGPSTVRAMETLSQPSWDNVITQVNVETVARGAGPVVDMLQNMMHEEGATYVPDPKTNSAPSIAVNGKVKNPSTDDMKDGAGQGGPLAMLKSPLGLAAIAIGGMLIYTSGKPGKSKKRGRR